MRTGLGHIAYVCSARVGTRRLVNDVVSQHSRSRLALSGLGIFWIVVAVPNAAAADGEVRATYAVTFARLPLATATLDLTVRGNAYTGGVTYRTAGASRILTDATGVATSNGAYKDRRFIPASFHLEHRNGRRSQKVVLGMVEGAVKTMTVDPPLALTSEQLPIDPAHLIRIADPLSALLIPAVSTDGKTPVGACDRTLSILDGLRRYDVKLEAKAIGSTSQKGFSGPTTVCRVELKPLAGQIAGANSRTANANASQIEVTFGRVDGLDLHLPMSLQASTQYGAVSVTLTEFAGASPTTVISPKN